jgi:hypothetical protein
LRSFSILRWFKLNCFWAFLFDLDQM